MKQTWMKKVILMVLVLAMTLSCFVISPMASATQTGASAEAAYTWIELDTAETENLQTAINGLSKVKMGGEVVNDGKARDYSWYTPDGGTKDAPYQIANAAQWVAFSDLSNGMQSSADTEIVGAVDFDGKYFVLTGDVNLDGYVLYPVGGKATIHLDGKNHTIKNADFSASSPALFTFLGRNSTIKNLVIDNVDIEASDNAAFLAIEAKVGLVCYNIHVKDTCSIVSGGNTAAGLIAILKDTEAHDEDARIDFWFCVNEADIAARATVGGIVADLQGCFAYNFDFCVNKGDLTSTATNQANLVGGIFGQFSRKANSVPNFGTITNCYNTGKLSCMAGTGEYVFAGGIFGVLRAFDGSEVEIENCFDYSARYEASADTAKHLWGGLAGHADNVQLLKWLFNSFAANDPSSENMYGVVVRWTQSATSLIDNCELLESITDEIINAWGEESTIKAEMERIDAGIAELKPNDLSYQVHEHMYSSACDAFCDFCGTEREAMGSHSFIFDCDTSCDLCGAKRTSLRAHTYDNDCDADCNICYEVREITHTYDNTCDTDCNVCGRPRTVSHAFSSDCDIECDVCHVNRLTKTAHTYIDKNDEECDLCGYHRDIGPTQPGKPQPDTDKIEDSETDTETIGVETGKPKPEDTIEIQQPTIGTGGLDINVSGCGASVCAPLLLLCAAAIPFVMKKKED